MFPLVEVATNGLTAYAWAHLSIADQLTLKFYIRRVSLKKISERKFPVMHPLDPALAGPRISQTWNNFRAADEEEGGWGKGVGTTGPAICPGPHLVMGSQVGAPAIHYQEIEIL